MQFFSSYKRLQEIFFKITPPPPPPQELNGRPLSRSVASIYTHKRTYARRASMYSYIELFPEKQFFYHWIGMTDTFFPL